MRKIFFSFVSATLAAVGLWNIYIYKGEDIRKMLERPCSRPLHYSIGQVDKRFAIKYADLQQAIAQAEAEWENQTGKDLFQYDPAADFRINLIFDERQQQSNEIKSIEETLSKLESTDAAIKQKYATIKADYDRKISAFESLRKDYEQRLARFNQSVEYWNQKGGAPEKEFEKMKQEEKSLKQTFEKLEAQRRGINDLASSLNSLANEEQGVVEKYNTHVNTYSSKFGQSREFEKGLYSFQNGLRSIDIYQFNETKDLRLILMHELGHALSIGHVENSESIMYYMVGDQDLDKPVLTDEDKAELDLVCQRNKFGFR